MKMTPAQWVSAVQALITLAGIIQAGKPPIGELMPEEKAQVDAANTDMNNAVAGWNQAKTTT